VFDLQIDKKKKTQICLKWVIIVEKTTAHSQNIVHVNALYNFKRKKYKTVCAELAFAKVTFDRMVMIFYRTCNVKFLYLLCSWIIAIFKECLIKSRNSHCLYAHKLYCDALKLFQKWKKLQNVPHIHKVFKFWGICSTILYKITLYICREYLAYSINIMLCYLFKKNC
jgi:hypothetical protein